MQYELYIDSLFLTHFVMNFYILIVVNKCVKGSATPCRILLGSLVGTTGNILMFFIGGKLIQKLVPGILIGCFGMIFITFRVKGFRNWITLLEKTVMVAGCMGGVLSGLTRLLSSRAEVLSGVFGILGLGGMACLFLGRQFSLPDREGNLRTVTLLRGGKQVTVTAIMDTGNSLREPVSGKPVSVVDERIFSTLWGKDEPEYYRAVPFRSIGKQKGILRGYLLPELWVEHNGMRKVFRDIYIAVSPEPLEVSAEAGAESIKMIINPTLFRSRD